MNFYKKLMALDQVLKVIGFSSEEKEKLWTDFFGEMPTKEVFELFASSESNVLEIKEVFFEELLDLILNVHFEGGQDNGQQ